ncbi:follistatin [Trichonephila clavipes]|nr:follistatin [Trichonephila clavipes]
MRISHKRLTIWKTTFAVLLPIYGHKCWKKSSKIGRSDWTTSEPAVAVLCQKSYLKSGASCENIRCRKGQRCLIDPKGGPPRCVTCPNQCQVPQTEMLCASNNYTYSTWCHMIQDACKHGILLEPNFSSAFTLMRLRAKTAWFWLHATTAILTVRCPQRHFHGGQRRI